MSKQLTAALLILAFTASTFCRTVIVLDYYARTTAYARDCINKARLAMHCNGKCQLMKKLEQEEKNDQENQERKMENKNEVVSNDCFCIVHFPTVPTTRHVLADLLIQQPVDASYALLRPPVFA